MKRLRKLTYLVLALLVAAIAVAATGCNKDKNDVDDTQPAVIMLSQTTAAMEQGDELRVTAKMSDDSSATFVWSSDNETVATAADGVIRAKSAGNATVTVTCGDKSATLGVTVTANKIPAISLVEDSVNIYKGGDYTLSPSVFYDGAEIENSDVSFAYTSADPSIASVNESGKVVGVELGDTVITITSEYRYHSLTKEFAVSVKEDSKIELSKEALELGTIDYESSKTSETLTATVTVNGEVLSLGAGDIAWSASGDCVTVEGGLVTAVSAGKGSVTAEYTTSGGKKLSLSCSVEVKKTEIDTEIEAVYDVMHSKFIAGGGAPADFPVFTALSDFAKANVKTVTAKVGLSDTVVKKSDSADWDFSKLKPSEAQIWTLETDKGVYSMTVDLWSALVYDQADLRAVKNYVVAEDVASFWSYTGTAYYGRIKLMEDITLLTDWTKDDHQIAPWNTAANVHGATVSKDYGFQGLFDGNGKKISGLKVASGSGLFGAIGENAVIKDVSFENAEVSGGWVGSRVGLIASTVYGGTFENIDITFAKFGTVAGDRYSGMLFGTFADAYVIQAGLDYYTAPVLNNVSVTLMPNAANTDGVLVGQSEKIDNADKALLDCTNVVIDGFDNIYWDGSAYVTEYDGIRQKVVKLSHEIDFDSSKAEFTLPATVTEFALADITSITYGGESLMSENAGGTVTIDTSKIDRYKTLNQKWRVVANGQEYSLEKLNVWTKMIGSETELRAVKDQANKETVGSYAAYYGNFKLKDNITVTGNWTDAIAPNVRSESDITIGHDYGFRGIFDGNNKTVSGFKVGESNALFGAVGKDAVIKNIKFTDVEITGFGWDGGRVGTIATTVYGGTFENIDITVSKFTGNDKYAGLLFGTVGDSYGSIDTNKEGTYYTTVELKNIKATLESAQGNAAGTLIGINDGPNSSNKTLFNCTDVVISGFDNIIHDNGAYVTSYAGVTKAQA